MYESILNGSSSLIATFLTNPIEVIKTQYQIAHHLKLRQIPINVYHFHGYRGFFRGVTSNCIIFPVFWAVFFEYKRHNFQPTKNQLLNNCINVYIASIIGSTLCNPIQVLKTRLQTSSLYKINHNSFTFAKEMFMKEGIKSFFKGYKLTIINNLQLIIQFPLYDYLKEKTDSVLISSTISKLVADLAFYPLGLVRTVQRDQRENISLKNLFIQIYKKNGIRSFYRGATIFTFLSMPNFILMMLIRDKFKSE